MSPPLPPVLQRWQREIERRLGNLERRILARAEAAASESPPVIAWGVTGVLTVGRSHDQDMWLDAVTLTEFMARLDTAGSTSTVIEVRRSGVAVATLTLAAGITTASVAVNANYTASDTYSVAVTTAGTGASDLQTTGVFG